VKHSVNKKSTIR